MASLRSATPWLLLAALLVTACDPSEPVSASDAGGTPASDAAVPPGDAGAALPDASSPADAGIAPDASTGPDASVEPGDGGSDPCQPNPCTDAAGHRTRCLWDGAGGFECHCEVGFHDADGLCCPPFSENVAGGCACIGGYALDEAGDCVVACSEESIAGFDGWCPAGEVCVQGACVEDHCEGHSCPPQSACVVRADGPFCLCEEGLHLSGGTCCPLDATLVGGQCECDAGFVEQAGACVADPNNPCLPLNPCAGAGLHRNTCVPDASAAGYTCDCNQGYRDQNGACVLAVWASCPANLVCRAAVCVPNDLSQEQCLDDLDCREFYPDAPTTCNASAAGGICLGCTEPSDCPGNTQCTPYATCALLCDDDNDCPYGRCYTATGYCGQARCAADADCFNGTVCIDEDGDGQGMCLRVPCVETACSPTNPGGTCAPGEACLYGACVGGCTPNPCDQELNKTVCSLASGAPACDCDAGYEPAADGRCLPAAAACPAGFGCAAGYCSDAAAPGFVCAADADCGSGQSCSPALPSGSCQGCSATSPCPAGLDCLAGYCLLPCTAHADCHAEMTCRGSGYCGRKPCAGGSDCAAPYVCVAGTDGGTCQRPTCPAR